MKEFSGYETKINGTLLQKLENLSDDHTLFVSDHYFVLITTDKYFFYLNPYCFLGELESSNISISMLTYLQNHCSQFKNPLKAETNPYSKKDWVDSDISFPETPDIGNHYSQLGNRIVTTSGRFYYFATYGGSRMCDIKNISVNEVLEMLYYAVMTRTPNFIKVITDLNCFKSS